MFLRHQILRGEMRDYFIDKVKSPLMKAIVIIGNRFPEPTRENVLHPNSQRLLDIQDKFFEYENNSGRKALFKAAFRIMIAVYEHDPYYHYRFDWFLEMISKSGWKVRSYGHPVTHWKEPAPYGGGISC